MLVEPEFEDVGANDASTEYAAGEDGEVFGFERFEISDGDLGSIGDGLQGKVATFALRPQGTAKSIHLWEPAAGKVVLGTRLPYRNLGVLGRERGVVDQKGSSPADG